jgi:pectate lyase
MHFKMKATTLAITASLALCASAAYGAANTGGFATADGNISTARKFTAATFEEINAIIAKARYNDAGTKVATGAYPLHIIYTGNEDALIAQIVKDHTVDANHKCPNPHWNDAYRHVEVKNYTAGITIAGANGSSANFGIVINGGSNNVVVKNMKIGALGGAKNDADMFRIDSGSNVLIDHNEMFAVNNECDGSPEGDLTFESAIDIKKASHNITVSYNFIHDSKKVGLDGSSPDDIDGGREITYHHNYYKNVNARLPLQRGGWIHVYNNLYDGITTSGINVRTGGYALIEKNWFQNANNPVTCRNDTVNCGKWDLRGNNATKAADNDTYNISWSDAGSGGINATDWKTTATFPKALTYAYEAASPQCVKDKLASVAGVAKNGAVLTASGCGATPTPDPTTPPASNTLTLSATGGDGKINLSWTATGTIKSAQVMRDTDANPSGRQRVAIVSGSARSYTDTAVVNGTQYWYWIKYTDANGTSGNSNAGSATPTSSSTPTPTPDASALGGTGDYPAGFTKCATLGQTCQVDSGTGLVAFGRKGHWVTKTVGVGKSIACTVAAFGSDPKGNPNKCSFQK